MWGTQQMPYHSMQHVDAGNGQPHFPHGYPQAAYRDTSLESQSMATNTHEHADGIVGLLASSGLARSESMDIANDPRFFAQNVIDKRMAAISGLSVVATIMVGNSLAQVFSMKKNIDLGTVDGDLQLIGFAMMNSVLFVNVLVTYVCVAQVFMVYRLMTAGSMGYEMAVTFYLNPNIAFWRHCAVKALLTSLPLFLLASGFRLLKMFDDDMPALPQRASPDPDNLPWWQARCYGVSVLGMMVFFVWFCMSMFLFYVNRKHLSVFQERYRVAKQMEMPLLSQVQNLRSQGRPPDV